jgi:hypothetical protein
MAIYKSLYNLFMNNRLVKAGEIVEIDGAVRESMFELIEGEPNYESTEPGPLDPEAVAYYAKTNTAHSPWRDSEWLPWYQKVKG